MVLRSPAGVVFCLVPWHGEAVRPRAVTWPAGHTSAVDQLCVDVPAGLFEAEATGLELAYADGRPVVAIRGISLGGVPLPRAWWGDIKGRNLVEEFGAPGGFWDRFARGVDDLRIRDGELWVRLRE